MSAESTHPSGAEPVSLDDLLVGERELWQDGPPHELFKRLRAECPVHWTDGDHRVPGGGRLLVGHDGRRRPRGQPRLADLLLELGGITALTNAILPLELTQAMFIGMDPPKHDRLKALFQRGFTPKRIAEHEDAIRAITRERARPARRAARPATSSTTSPSRSSRA